MTPGNLDWVGNEFTFNAGAGLVISQQEDQRNSTVVEQLRDVFERDWSSSYTHSLQPDLLPICNRHQANRHQANRLVPLKAARPPHSSTVPLAGSPLRHLPAPIQTRPCNNDCQHSNKQEPSRGESTTASPLEEQPEDRQVYVKVSHSDSPMGSLLPSQPIESSGGRELQSGPLWPPGTDD